MRNLLGVAALAVMMMSGSAAASEVERVAHGVVITPDQGAAKRVRVLAYGDASFRVTAIPASDLDLPKSLMVIADASGDPVISEAKGLVTLKLPRATAEIRLSDGRVQFRDAAGKLVLTEEARRRFTATSVDGKPFLADRAAVQPRHRRGLLRPWPASEPADEL